MVVVAGDRGEVELVVAVGLVDVQVILVHGDLVRERLGEDIRHVVEHVYSRGLVLGGIQTALHTAEVSGLRCHNAEILLARGVEPDAFLQVKVDVVHKWEIDALGVVLNQLAVLKELVLLAAYRGPDVQVGAGKDQRAVACVAVVYQLAIVRAAAVLGEGRNLVGLGCVLRAAREGRAVRRGARDVPGVHGTGPRHDGAHGVAGQDVFRLGGKNDDLDKVILNEVAEFNGEELVDNAGPLVVIVVDEIGVLDLGVSGLHGLLHMVLEGHSSQEGLVGRDGRVEPDDDARLLEFVRYGLYERLVARLGAHGVVENVGAAEELLEVCVVLLPAVDEGAESKGVKELDKEHVLGVGMLGRLGDGEPSGNERDVGEGIYEVGLKRLSELVGADEHLALGGNPFCAVGGGGQLDVCAVSQELELARHDEGDDVAGVDDVEDVLVILIGAFALGIGVGKNGGRRLKAVGVEV